MVFLVEGRSGACNSQIETLLPKDAVLWVFPPSDAIAKNAWARQDPTKYKGSDEVPKLLLGTHNLTFSTGGGNESPGL
jgi:hypothetical protein